MDTIQTGFCAYCGSEIEPDDLFCPQCGRKIEKSEIEVQDYPEETTHEGTPKRKKKRVFFKFTAVLLPLLAFAAAIAWYLSDAQRETPEVITYSPRPSSVAFSPGGATIACGLMDGSIQILPLRDGQPLARLKISSSPIIFIQYHSRGNRLAACSRDGKLNVISIPEYRTVFSSQWKKSPDTHLFALSEDWNYMMIDAANSLELYDGRGRLLRTFTLYEDESPKCLSISDKSNLVIAGFADRIIAWNIHNGGRLNIPFPDARDVRGMSLGYNGSLLFVNASPNPFLYDIAENSLPCIADSEYPSTAGISVDWTGRKMAVCYTQQPLIDIFDLTNCSHIDTIRLANSD